MKRHRITLFAFVALLVTLSLSACSSSKTEVSSEQIDRAQSLVADVERIAGLVSETSDELAGLQARVTGVEQNIDQFSNTASLTALDRTGDIPEPPPGKVAFRLSFDYRPAPLPGEGLQTHEPSPEVNGLWAMESLPAGAPIPVGNAIQDNTLFLEPGESRMVTLVYENPTNEDIAFLALPHQDSPGQLGSQVLPSCFCFSFPYKAPAGGAWYRVIQMTAGADIEPGAKVDVLWTILTDPAVFPVEEKAEAPEAPPASTESVELPGKVLAAQKGCAGCHSADGSSRVGPTWLGLFGKEETLADGTTVTVDEAYLHESIVDPNAKVVKGFPANVMPTNFGETLSEEEIQAIIEYIKSLGQ